MTSHSFRWFLRLMLLVILSSFVPPASATQAVSPASTVQAASPASPTQSSTRSVSQRILPQSAPAFPATPILDSFSQADGALSQSWAGNTTGYQIQQNQLIAQPGGAIYWTNSFAAQQEVYVTLPNPAAGAGEVDLLLKGQGTGGCDVLEVLYAPSTQTVQLWGCANDTWVQHGSTLAVTFQAGDRFGARFADGAVTIFQNTTILGTVPVESSWPFSAEGGRIGVWIDNATAFPLDDVGGGSLTSAPAPTTGTMQVSGSIASGSLSITAEGRFTLVFDQAHKWQAGVWYDLQSDPSHNLARNNGPSLNYNVIQSPLELYYQGWNNLETATNPSITLVSQSTEQVVLQTGWQWQTADGSSFTVAARHSIHSSGLWEVQTALTNTSSSAHSIQNQGIEYAFTNVRQQNDWLANTASDQSSFDLTRTDGPTPHPQFVAHRGDTGGLLNTVSTDGDLNRYWTLGNISLDAGASWQTSWTNEIWRDSSPLQGVGLVQPLLDCVIAHEDGHFTAAFSYDNPNPVHVNLPIGNANWFQSAPADRGQPSRFAPGRSASYPQAPVMVDFWGEPLTWMLNGLTVTASSASPRCPELLRVDAGVDQLITTPTTTLQGLTVPLSSVSHPITLTWSLVSGPGSASMSDAHILNPAVTVSTAGRYMFQLMADDGLAQVTDSVTIVQSAAPDLRMLAVNRQGLVNDGQSLHSHGTLEAQIQNSSQVAVPLDIQVAFFEDRNGNAQFDALSDSVLARSTVPGLAAGSSITVTASVSGTVNFVGNQIFAMVDSAQTIAETNENNNVASTQNTCAQLPKSTVFSPTIEFEWPQATTPFPTFNQVMMAPVVADLDGDHIPEIIFLSYSGTGGVTHHGPAYLRAISGRDGHDIFAVTSVVTTGDAALRGDVQIAVANLDVGSTAADAALPEIIAAEDTSTPRLIIFNHDGSIRTRATVAPSGGMINGGIAIANLDGSQNPAPEIIVGATVFNSDLTRRWVGTGTIGNNHSGPLSIVADIDLDGSPEVIAGPTVYKANGTIKWRTLNVGDGFPAVANFDSDPEAEVVLITRGNLYLLDNTGSIIWGPKVLPGGGDGGAPTIADMDGDGKLEIGIAGYSRYVIFNDDGTIYHQYATQDVSSNSTGSSVFDFDGDGRIEVVYGDENTLYIYDVQGKTTRWSTPSPSGTLYELPVIADVDLDGNAEIVKISNNYGGRLGHSGIRVYGDRNDAWVATRPLWNQHSYHITNINDDLSVPVVESPNWASFNNYRLNSFLQGCATARPDLTASSVGVVRETSSITLTVRVGNGGSLFAPAGVSVAWYSAAPTQGGQLLGLSSTTVTLQPGQYEDLSITVPLTTTAMPLWVVVDANGQGQGTVTEEREDNNAYNSHVYLTNPVNQPPSVDAGPDQTVTQSTAVTLQGTVSDDQLPINQLSQTWSMLSGPGTVSFGNAHQASTTVSFPAPGQYRLVLSAYDGEYTRSDTLIITVTAAVTPPPEAPTPLGPLAIPGWIGGPANQATLSESVPMTLTMGVNLTNGTLSYWPAENPQAIITLVSNLSGSGGSTLATFDPTLLANGSYVIQLEGTNSLGETKASGIMVTVAGDYKPGRVRFTVTDLTVPLAGMPITIGRTYDSLERQHSSDFGYGWSLEIGNPRLTVDPAHNVTLTQPNGQRVTFYFAPQSYGGVLGFLQKPAYLPEPGVYGSLTANGCALVVQSGGWHCFLDAPTYAPTTYTYTDPSGRVFVMGADGKLQSITDLNQNRLTFTPQGITSSAGGMHVSFQRDAQGRITSITDPAGQSYGYGYDAAGDLTSVTYPKPQSSDPHPVVQYVYVPGQPHLFERSLDPAGHIPSMATYYTEPASLIGRLKSTTEYVDATTVYTTTFAYDLAAKTITTTNPDGGQVLREYGTSVLPQGNASAPGIVLLRETVDVRITAQGQRERRTSAYRYTATGQLMAMALPDPITGQAATLASNPLLCASRNICYSYDSKGNRTHVADGQGHRTVTTYNAFNRPATITRSDQQVQTLTYDPAGNLLTIHDSQGVLGGYTYDDHGNPLTRYLGGNPTTATRYTYDQYGRVATTTDPMGTITRYENYDFMGNPGKVTIQAPDGLGGQRISVAITSYNALGHVTRTTLGDGTNIIAETSYTYDSVGNVHMVRDGLTGWTSTTDYYPNGAVKQITSTGSQATNTTYTWRGAVATARDATGRTYRATYDLAGQLVSATEAWVPGKAPTTQYHYDLAGRQTGVTDANGVTSSIEYDTLDRPVALEDPIHGAGHPVQFQYDAANRIETTIGVNGVATHAGFDARGFPTDTYSAYGTPYQQQTHETHDGLGRVLTHTDHSQRTTTYAYNAAGHVTQVTNPLSQTTHYLYTGQGQLRRVTDAKNQMTTFDYDALGRPISKTWPDGATETWAYRYVHPVDSDPTHDLPVTTGMAPESVQLRVAQQLVDQHVNYAYYSAQGQLLRQQLFDGETISYAYSSGGVLQSVQDQRGLTCYRYTDAGQIAAVEQLGTGTNLSCATSPVRRRVGYDYDAVGHRTMVTIQVGGTTQQIGYLSDALGRLCAVKHGAQPVSCSDPAAYTYGYEDHVGSADVSQRTTLTTPSGMIETHSYDPLGRLSALVQQVNGSPLASYTYSYDSANRRQQVIELDGSSTTWRYDDANRLTRELRQTATATPVWDLTYSYDAVGNRLSMQEAVSGQQTSYTYRPNGLDQLASSTTNGVTRSYQYDARGNLRSDGVLSYDYDARNQLSSVTGPGLSQQNQYDALGNRIRQTSNGVSTDYLWDEFAPYGVILAELDSAGAGQSSYLRAGLDALEQTTGGMTQVLMRDGQGNTRALLNPSTNTISERYSYDAFGTMRSSPTNPATSQLYTGQQYDQASGLYQMRARYYNPADGRFLSRDPYAMGAAQSSQHNRYVYGANNPVNGFDPSGELFVETVTTNEMNKEQEEKHAKFHAGTDWAYGEDLVALRMESIFSAIFDEMFVKTIWSFFGDVEKLLGLDKKWSIEETITLGLGTVYHLGKTKTLRPGTITKAVSVNADRGTCQWSKLARQIGCSKNPSYAAALRTIVVAGLKASLPLLYPRSDAVGIIGQSDTENYADRIMPWKKDDAEILVARWAIRNFGGPPTPERMLDIATSRNACDDGDASGLPCILILPALKGIQPLLFETTYFRPEF